MTRKVRVYSLLTQFLPLNYLIFISLISHQIFTKLSLTVNLRIFTEVSSRAQNIPTVTREHKNYTNFVCGCANNRMLIQYHNYCNLTLDGLQFNSKTTKSLIVSKILFGLTQFKCQHAQNVSLPTVWMLS